MLQHNFTKVLLLSLFACMVFEQVHGYEKSRRDYVDEYQAENAQLNKTSTFDEVLSVLAMPGFYLQMWRDSGDGMPRGFHDIGTFHIHSIPFFNRAFFIPGLLNVMCYKLSRWYTWDIFRGIRWHFEPTPETEKLLNKVMKAITDFSTRTDLDFNNNSGEDLGDISQENLVTQQFYGPLKEHIDQAIGLGRLDHIV